MTFTWTREDSPRWDADKQRLFGPAELAAVGLAPPAPGEPVANEWWRVTDGGEVAGYGWLDSEWGDAQITFFVAPGQRGRGVGQFILEHLEAEAAARGLNYIYNIVPETHPNGPWMRNWLSLHGFREASRGQLRRRVEATPTRAQAQASGAPQGAGDTGSLRSRRRAARSAGHDMAPNGDLIVVNGKVVEITSACSRAGLDRGGDPDRLRRRW